MVGVLDIVAGASRARAVASHTGMSGFSEFAVSSWECTPLVRFMASLDACFF